MCAAFPVRLLLIALAGGLNRRQLEIIERLREENRVLKAHLGQTPDAGPQSRLTS